MQIIFNMKISRSMVHKVGYGVQWCAIPLQPVLGCSGVTIAIAVETKSFYVDLFRFV